MRNVSLSALVLMSGLTGCKGSSAKFSSTRSPKAAEQAAGEAKSTTKTVVNNTVVNMDYFKVPDVAKLVESVEVPAQPLRIEAFTWKAPGSTIIPFKVEGSTQRVDSFTKLVPITKIDVSPKMIDYFITIDTSESFVKGSYNNRANQLVLALADQVYSENYDIRFVLGGYLVTSTSITQVVVAKSATLGIDDFKNQINAGIIKLFQAGSGSIERPFKSMSLSLGAMRKDAVNGIFYISDNHNGLLKDNSPSPSVNFAGGSADNSQYLPDIYLAPNVALVTVMGAMYRQTNGICDDSATPERSSQYEAQNQRFKALLGAPYNSGNFTGDICAASLDFTAIKNFGASVINLRKSRVLTAADVDVYPAEDDQFNMKTLMNGQNVNNAIVNKRVVISSGPFDTLRYAAYNSYDNVVFNLQLQPADDSGVILKSDGQPDFACARSDSLGPNDPCIFNSRGNVTLRNPRTPYAIGSSNLNFTATYVNKVVSVNTFSFDSDFPMVADSLIIKRKSDGSAAATSNVNFSPDRKHLDIVFGDYLQPGDYEVSFVKSIPSKFTLKYPIASVTSNLQCLKDSSGVDVKNGTLVFPPEHVLACALNSDKLTVNFAGFGTTDTNFVIAYLANTDPLSSFATQKEPDAGSLKVTFTDSTGTKQELSSDKFEINGRIITLNGVQIMPGMRADWTYTSTPVKPSLVFKLSAVPLSNTPVQIVYRLDKNQIYTPLIAKDYTLQSDVFTPIDKGFGAEYQVTYRTVDSKSEKTSLN